MTSPDPLVTVVIVTHNSSALLADCLASVQTAASGIPSQVIVVDNNSSDHSATIASRSASEAIIITNRTNAGFAAACNQGADAAGGRYLLFLNPDVRLDSDSIRALLAVYDGGQPIGLAAGRMRHPGGMFQPSCRRFPTVKNLIFSRGSVLSFVGKNRKGKTDKPYTLPDSSTTTIVDAVAGTMVMIEKRIFDKVGQFDERFFMYMEDTDLCLRLDRAGYVNLFVPSAGAVHYWRKGSSSGMPPRVWYHHRSVWRYFGKNLPIIDSFLVAAPLAANLVVSLVLATFRRRTS